MRVSLDSIFGMRDRHPAVGDDRPPHFIGAVSCIENAWREALPDAAPPCFAHGALQGEGVSAAYDPARDRRALYSVNAQTCVIATLYNPENRCGAVIHFEHNIGRLIDDALDAAVEQLDLGSNQAFASTLTGGVWLLGGADIGERVRQSLHRLGSVPVWNQWTLSPLFQHNYGVLLDLKDGRVTTFGHSLDAVHDFYAPLLRDALAAPAGHVSAEQARARDFVTRFSRPAIAERDGLHEYVDRAASRRSVRAQDVERFRIPIHGIDMDR